MTMISIQKLPSLKTQMRGALRSHIMRKRQRLKQEMEQDAIMERMKKEREQKRIQDAMTLDQIKEQLSNLEKRLETLRNEKHDLFVQLKQVLKEGSSSKRKTQDEGATSGSDASQQQQQQQQQQQKTTSPPQQKRPKLGPNQADHTTSSASSNQVQSQQQTSKPTTSTTTTTSQPSQAHTPHQQQNIVFDTVNRVSDNDKKLSAQQHHHHHHQNRQITSLAQQAPSMPPSSRRQPMSSHEADPSCAPQTGSLQHSNLIIGLPSMAAAAAAAMSSQSGAGHPFINQAHHNHPDMSNFASRHESLPPNSSTSSMSPQNLASLQAHFRNSLGAGLPPHGIPPELLMANRLDPNYQKFAAPLGPHRLPITSMPLDMPLSLSQRDSQQQQLDGKLLNSYNAARMSLGGAAAGQLNKPGSGLSRIDEQLLALKKAGPRGGMASLHPSRFIVDGSLQSPLAHLNLLNQAALAGSTLNEHSLMHLGGGPSDMNQAFGNFSPRKPLSNHNNLSRSQPGVDFNNLPNHLKPGMMLPGLGHLYAPQQSGPSLGPPSSIYGPGGEIDLKHLNALYHPGMSQQLGADPIAHFNNSLSQQQQHHQQQQQQQQQEQASRMFSARNSQSGHHHRRPSPKRHPYR